MGSEMCIRDRSQLERPIAAACVAHLVAEAKLITTDPVIKWAATRWPTYVEIVHYAIDHLVPKYGGDPSVVPLGRETTSALLLNASALFASKGMDWRSYYHQMGSLKFPEGPVSGWNTHDHGVNNAEGAMRWPAVTWRMTGLPDDAAQQDVVLRMLDLYQGQVAALFCADEVFCGRAPHRGESSALHALLGAQVACMRYIWYGHAARPVSSALSEIISHCTPL